MFHQLLVIIYHLQHTMKNMHASRALFRGSKCLGSTWIARVGLLSQFPGYLLYIVIYNVHIWQVLRYQSDLNVLIDKCSCKKIKKNKHNHKTNKWSFSSHTHTTRTHTHTPGAMTIWLTHPEVCTLGHTLRSGHESMTHAACFVQYLWSSLTYVKAWVPRLTYHREINI